MSIVTLKFLFVAASVEKYDFFAISGIKAKYFFRKKAPLHDQIWGGEGDI